MREIKFRGWNGKMSKTFNMVDMLNIYGRFDNLKVKDGTFFMQYTGIKDKNGKEIYEGDIMAWDKKERDHIELVERDYELLSMRRNNWNEFCVIVGNKYENVDLFNKLN